MAIVIAWLCIINILCTVQQTDNKCVRIPDTLELCQHHQMHQEKVDSTTLSFSVEQKAIEPLIGHPTYSLKKHISMLAM